jgi:hypothetical protein
MLEIPFPLIFLTLPNTHKRVLNSSGKFSFSRGIIPPGWPAFVSCQNARIAAHEQCARAKIFDSLEDFCQFLDMRGLKMSFIRYYSNSN